MFTDEFRIRARIGEVLFVVLVGLSATSCQTGNNAVTLMVGPSTTVATGSSLQLNCFWFGTPTPDASFVYFQKQDALGWLPTVIFDRQDVSMQSNAVERAIGYYYLGNVSYVMMSLNYTFKNDSGTYRCLLKSGQTSDAVVISVVDPPTPTPSPNSSNSLTFVSPSATVETGNTVNFICAWFAYGSPAQTTTNLNWLNSTGYWALLGWFTVEINTSQAFIGQYSRLIAYAYNGDGFSYVWIQLLQSQVSDTSTYQCSLSDGQSSSGLSINVVPATSTAAISTVISPESTGLSLYEWVIIGAGAFLAIVLVVVLVVCKVRYNFKPCLEREKEGGMNTTVPVPNSSSELPTVDFNRDIYNVVEGEYNNNDRQDDTDSSYSTGSALSDAYSQIRDA